MVYLYSHNSCPSLAGDQRPSVWGVEFVNVPTVWCWIMFLVTEADFPLRLGRPLLMYTVAFVCIHSTVD